MADFDIPESLRTFLKLDGKTEGRFDLASNLVSPEKKGELISLAALAEEEVSSFITRYLAQPKRADILCGMLDDNLTFSRKIDVLKRILSFAEPDDAVRMRHLAFLAALRKLRNKGAHSYGIRPAEIEQLAADSVAMALVKDFPDAIWAGIKELREYLESIGVDDRCPASSVERDFGQKEDQ